MKVLAISLIVGAMLSCSSCMQSSASRPVHLNQALSMTPREIGDATRRATEGDRAAAIRLSHYHTLFGSPDEAIRWARIGAIHGDPTSKYNVGFLLLQRGRTEDRAEAMVWLTAAAQDGVELAAKTLAREKKPNKVPEPTSGTVTPPAEPGVAPVPPVAHL